MELTYGCYRGGDSESGVARVYSPPCPWDTHYQFSIKNSTLKTNVLVVEHTADSVDARTCSNKKTVTWMVYATPLMTLTTDLGLSIRVFLFRVSMFEHID